MDVLGGCTFLFIGAVEGFLGQIGGDGFYDVYSRVRSVISNFAESALFKTPLFRPAPIRPIRSVPDQSTEKAGSLVRSIARLSQE